jgi:hypothetical protein
MSHEDLLEGDNAIHGEDAYVFETLEVHKDSEAGSEGKEKEDASRPVVTVQPV